LEFKNGDLIIFRVEPGLHYTEDGFATIITDGGSLFLPEAISLNSYPSSNDFRGNLTKVNCGDIGIILEYLGRPRQINQDPEWFQYDVYEIYINGFACHAFKQNLRRINRRVDRVF
jgi:hypothetical protein